MKSIEVRNVNEAVTRALPHLLDEGLREESRNGVVLVAPTPVCTTYRKPKEHVLFGETRDANPFFHLMEALWMLSGANDLEWPMQFNKRFKEYSDDGETIHGAYGYRWREYFFFDQIQEIISHLTENPASRRAVLSMWSPEGDLIPHKLRPYAYGVAGEGGTQSRDVPCNTHAYFDIRGGKLNMTVCNRSNDAIWGAYGANVVHFSLLQEYIATRLFVEVGVYRQMSNNFHAYTDIYNEEKLKQIVNESNHSNYYETEPSMVTMRLMTVDPTLWHTDLVAFLSRELLPAYHDPFFATVAEPMYQAWCARKRGEPFEKVVDILSTMPNVDWRRACLQWVTRREEVNNAA